MSETILTLKLMNEKKKLRKEIEDLKEELQQFEDVNTDSAYAYQQGLDATHKQDTEIINEKNNEIAELKKQLRELKRIFTGT